MTAYLGGTEIRTVEWVGRNAVEVAFRMTEFSDRLVQLYAGRRLVGATDSTSARIVRGDVPAGPRATPLSLVVVERANRLVDYGQLLGWKPWNVWCVTWTPPAAPSADLSHFDIAMSPTAGASYDLTNVVGRVDYDSAAASYSFQLPPFESSGDFEVAIVPRDDAIPLGNDGTVVMTTIPAVVYPLDLPLDSDGRRFTVSVAAGELTASFTCPTS